MRKVYLLFLNVLAVLLLTSAKTYLPEQCDVDYGQFQVQYDTIHRVPRLVYYTVDKSKLGSYGRASFGADPKIHKSSQPGDYYNSGYDRGHIFPAASSHSILESSESFWMTNMAPQLPDFNRGIWKSLEHFERTTSSELVYVIAGPVIRDTDPKMKGTDITVPSEYFKVIYCPANKRMIGFLIPQVFEGVFTDYVVTVDYIESLIGIDVFHQLNDRLENKLESVQGDPSSWN